MTLHHVIEFYFFKQLLWKALFSKISHLSQTETTLEKAKYSEILKVVALPDQLY
jgi:hypothetical protein